MPKTQHKVTNPAMAQALAAALPATNEGTAGGAVLDNGPADPSKTSHETPQGSQTANALEKSTDTEIGKISWTDKGREDGKAVKDAESGAFKKVREILMHVAEGFVKYGLDAKGDLQEIPKLWLDGYGEAMGRERKSEVRSILIGACREPVERSTGTYRQGDASKGEDATKQYVNKETHSGLEWLNLCTSYASLVKTGRDLKGSEGRSKIIKIKTELSNKAFDAVQSTVKDASASQSSVIVQGALNKMQAAVDSDRMLLSTALGVMIRLEQSSKDPAVKAYATKFGQETSLLIGRIEKAAIEAGVVKAPVSQMPQTPAPATTEVPEVPEQQQAAA